MFNRDLVIEAGIETIKIEAEEVSAQINYINDEYVDAVKCLFECKGKVIVSGIGKSGIIGTKFAASLASTGTPSFFIHPGEAFHGDLGMIENHDVVVLLSNSGETDEVLKLMPYLKSSGNKTIAITGNPLSTLAENSLHCITSKVTVEACSLNLAPTSSTTAALAITDAIVVSLMRLRDFKPECFARFHPGGSLGKRLLTNITDIMNSENLPLVHSDADVKEVVSVISACGFGIAVVYGEQVLGVITDGDIRRAMEARESEFFTLTARDIGSKNPVTINADATLVEAEELLKDKVVNTLLVIDSHQALKGILKIKDVLN